jgi:hypothetical protein
MFNFTNYHLRFHPYFTKFETPRAAANEFLTWLIGFTKRDGSFIVSGKVVYSLL